MIRTLDTPEGPIEYWRAYAMYATSYAAKFLGGFDGQVKSLVVIPIYQDHLRPVDQELGDFGRRGSARRQDDRFLPD